jgi:predicted ester cyclase
MNPANKEIARRFIHAFEAGDQAALESTMVEDTTDHNPLPGQRPGRSGVLDTLAMYRAAFPDLTLTIERQVAEGDLVAQNGLAKGTNTGPLMDQPATGAPAQFAWIDMYRIAEDRITEIWHLEDVAGLLQQLATAPSSAST